MAIVDEMSVFKCRFFFDIAYCAVWQNYSNSEIFQKAHDMRSEIKSIFRKI